MMLCAACTLYHNAPILILAFAFGVLQSPFQLVAEWVTLSPLNDGRVYPLKFSYVSTNLRVKRIRHGSCKAKNKCGDSYIDPILEVCQFIVRKFSVRPPFHGTRINCIPRDDLHEIALIAQSATYKSNRSERHKTRPEASVCDLLLPQTGLILTN